jgi:hypothetical protein
MLPKAGYRERLTTALGRPLRFYRDYASQIAGCSLLLPPDERGPVT